MTTVNAGNAFVTISIREAMSAGLSAAKAKMASFADYAEKSMGKKVSKAMSFGDLAKGLATGAVLHHLTQIALENKNIAAAAERANTALRSMVLDVTADLEGELIWLLETAGFLIKKMADGFKAIIAIVKDFGAIISEKDLGFKNFNKVLDNLDRPSSGARTKEIDNTNKAVQRLKTTTRELTDIQKQYDDAWMNAREAGAGAIADLQRDLDVLRRGETSVKADEIYKDKLDAELKLLDAEKKARGQAGGFTNADNAAIQAARDKAQALRDQFVFLTEQKAKIEEIRKADEDAAKARQEALQLEIEKKKELNSSVAIISGTSSAFAMAAGGGNVQFQTQKDLLKETRESKEIAKKNLEQLTRIAAGGMVFG
jgi:hypothetical protein